MISTSLRVFLTTGLLLYFLLIFSLLKRKTLSLKYTLLWIFGGLGLATLLIFPELLNWFIHIVGIQIVSNGLFAMILFFVLIILISITSIVSKQSDNIKRLVQDNALMEKRIRELEGKVWAGDIIGSEGRAEIEGIAESAGRAGTEGRAVTEDKAMTEDKTMTEDKAMPQDKV